MTLSETTTRTIDAPGVSLTYDVRPGGLVGLPPLFLVGSPMAASGFGELASHFADRTVVLYDPRGAERSTKTDAATTTRTAEHADDLHRIIQAVGAPADLFANSGGAVNALALVAAHSGDVRLLVAHEPPLVAVLPDRANASAAIRAVGATYERSGFGAGMAHFIAVTGHRGPFPDDIASQPAPDPAMFGLPAEDDGDRTDVLLGQNLIATTHYEPDFDALRTASTRIVLAAGAESEGQLANRGAFGVAERLGTIPVIFPSHHGGFVGGAGEWAGQPEAFAATLRAVLGQA